jgi:hypothetical protein
LHQLYRCVSGVYCCLQNILYEEGIYNQTVITFKNNIRIIAKGPGVIFDGNSTFFTAITLSNVVGVAIEGIKIRHYRADGISILSGSGNRIVNNTINLVNTGIQVRGSNGNLAWKNEICNCTHGILFTLGTGNNWIIENIVKDCSGNAFFSFSSDDSNNSFIANIAIRNGSSGLNLLGNNHLVLKNILIDNGIGTVINDGSDSAVIGNTVKGSDSSGLSVQDRYRNYFAGDNHIKCNNRTGIENRSQFGMFLDNEISYNSDNGILLDPNAVGNLVMDNKLVCNIPDNIVDRGTNNNLINNKEKPCEPCESPSDVCGDCSNEEIIKLEDTDFEN